MEEITGVNAEIRLERYDLVDRLQEAGDNIFLAERQAGLTASRVTLPCP